MSKPNLIAKEIIQSDPGQITPVGRVVLDYEARYVRRKVLACTNGDKLLVDFPKARVLEHGDLMLLEDGRTIEVVAAAEELLEVHADTPHQLTVIAYHLGNRHLPVQIEEARLLIARDHVIEDMLGKLGAKVAHVSEPFNPEGGAYGLGRTHGHDHGNSHNHEHS